MVPEPMAPALGERFGWREFAWLGFSAALPALVATSQLDLFTSGGGDAALVRTAGLGYTGAFRALDAWLAAPFAAIPLGTRTLRAELPGVFLLAATAALGFVLVRRCLVAVAGRSAWASVVAAISMAAVTLSYPFQHEATCPGSVLVGVVIVLLALASSGNVAVDTSLVTLGLTYEVPVGLFVIAVGMTRRLLPRRDEGSGPSLSGIANGLAAALAAAAGLVPFGLAAARSHVAPLSTSASTFAAPFGEGSSSGAGARRAVGWIASETGEAAAVLTVVGLVWALRSRKAWPAVIPLAVAMAAAALVFVARGTADGAGSPGLVVLLMMTAFVGVAMQEAVLRVARARLPLAVASAAMVVLLEAALPAVQLDDGLARAATAPRHALSTWEDAVFAGLPSASLTIVSAPKLYARLLATKASGGLPGDLQLVPTFDPSNEAEAAAVARDPRLVPLFRDVALTGVPQELSLSTLAAQRPLALAADPLWDRNLTRHLLPGGLLAVFEPEPRGGADRRRALDDSEGWRARLATSLGPHADRTLATLTGAILFDRALAAAATGEREVAMRSIQDAATFAPKDPRVQELTLREVSSRGAIDVRDLARQGLADP